MKITMISPFSIDAASTNRIIQFSKSIAKENDVSVILPNYDKYSNFASDGVELLLINTGEDTETIMRFIRSFSVIYTVLSDRDAKAAVQYRVAGVPTYVFIDKKGNVTYQDNVFSEEQYKALLK